MIIAWILSALGQVVGALIGLALALRPQQAATLLRLSSIDAEVRGALGGFLFVAHAAPLALLALNAGYRDLAIAAMNAGAAAALGAAWIGAAAGRAFVLWRAKRPAHWRSCAPEATLGALIAAPWLFWLGAALNT